MIRQDWVPEAKESFWALLMFDVEKIDGEIPDSIPGNHSDNTTKYQWSEIYDT